MSVRALIAAAMLAGAMPAHAADCSTVDLKLEALDDFLGKHYSVGASANSIPDEDTGLMDVMFALYFPPDHPLRHDGSEWPVLCTGWVRVADDCGISDAEGTPLDSARSREQTIDCELQRQR